MSTNQLAPVDASAVVSAVAPSDAPRSALVDTPDEFTNLLTEQQELQMLRDWLSAADLKADELTVHLRRVLEIAWTWRPDYATPMDSQTLTLAAEAIGE